MPRQTPRLASITLRAPHTKIDRLKWFYTEVLGMNHMLSCDTEGNIESFIIPQHHPKYPECVQKHKSIDLKFLSMAALGPYQPSKEDLYWKIGLVVNDVNVAADTINTVMESRKDRKTDDTQVQHGSQFMDIGFVTHLKDPCDFTIELLQTTFESNAELRQQLIKEVIREEDEVILKVKAARSSKSDKDTLIQSPSLLATQPFVIGQVTTRITDSEKSLDFYTNVLKMKLLSIQEVSQYRFTLYFLGYTDDNPPVKDDLKHVNNREWLWQRKYTTLELQWRWNSKKLNIGKDDSAGLDSIEIEIANEKKEESSSFLQNIKENANFCPVPAEKSSVSKDGYSTQLHGTITDPDGLKIRLISRFSENEICEA